MSPEWGKAYYMNPKRPGIPTHGAHRPWYECGCEHYVTATTNSGDRDGQDARWTAHDGHTDTARKIRMDNAKGSEQIGKRQMRAVRDALVCVVYARRFKQCMTAIRCGPCLRLDFNRLDYGHDNSRTWK